MPDTNTLYSDLFLEGPLIRTILAAEKATGLRLVIPEVVIDELRNKVRERLQKQVEAAGKVRQDLVNLGALSPDSRAFSISHGQQQAVYERFEESVAQLAKDGRILGYPSISPKELADRSIRKQPPFEDRDRGMRDTLIWLTLQESATASIGTGSRVVMVTKDGAFLNNGKTDLNESLVAELTAKGTSRDSVVVLPNLKNVVQTLIASKLPAKEMVKIAIEGGQVEDFTPESDVVLLQVHSVANRHPELFELGGYLFVDFDIVEEAWLESIEYTVDLGDGEVLVESNWTCEAAAEGFEHPYFGESLTVKLRFSLSSIVEVSEGQIMVVSHEVSDLSVVDFVEAHPLE